HGVVAQSIGGGGGLVVGGRALVPAGGPGGGGARGDGGVVAVRLQAGSLLRTAGDGAFGVLAQSIGGGGGLAGDVSAVGQTQLGTGDAVRPNDGAGGAVGITLDRAQVATNGRFAPGVFAQSIGGGGGLMNLNGNGASHVQARGTAGGEGAGGAVTVALTGSRVVAAGLGSAGILAQSDGSGAGGIQVSLDAASAVSGGLADAGSGQPATAQDAAAIRLLGGTANRIDNAGVIGRADSSGIAILTLNPGGNTTVSNTGQILGDVILNDQPGRSLLANRPGGILSAPGTIDLGGGTLRNDGALHVGGIGTAGQTVLTGQLIQGPGGRLVLETNHAGGASDQLLVLGAARLAGTLEVRPLLLANRPVTVLRATGGLVVEDGLAATRTPLLRFETLAGGDSLRLQPVAEFAGAAAGLGENQRRVAAHLQQLWDRGAPLEAGFTALAGTADEAAYGRSLDSLSGQTLGAIAVFRQASSHRFVAAMLDECGDRDAADAEGCAWGRAQGSQADQGSRGGSLGYQARSWTFQAGLQRVLAPGWSLGASLAYESSSFRGDQGTSRVSGEAMMLGAVLRFQQGRWELSGGLDLGYGWYDSKRRLSAGSFAATAEAEPTAWHAGAHARLAYRLPLEGGYLQPRLDLHLTHLRGGGYTESGAAPFNLAVEAERATLLTAEPAIELGGRLRLGAASLLRPYASLGVAALAPGDWAARARFAGQEGSDGFRARTPMPELLAKLTFGADLLGADDWELGLLYRLELGDHYVAHAGVGRLAYRF
ncbi:autotransporter outer membrane beta-barrel domain-containing protein, partial [Teichococcus deserti]|uniref:autotransporter outer membrane beta-barrel domain-containing protein n=1 Tax=Teichococcus deserti TaxID=1817963 RepID=UPI0010543B42